MLFSHVDLEGLFAIRGEIGHVTLSLDDGCQGQPIRLFVFDDEHTCHDTKSLLRPLGGSGLVSVLP